MKHTIDISSWILTEQLKGAIPKDTKIYYSGPLTRATVEEWSGLK
jgi:hypothetical protein